jgi:hypothetical protein
MLHFIYLPKGEEPFYSAVFKQGFTFEWVKNKVAEQLEGRYEDISLYMGEKRIPEPFCLIDMQVASGTGLEVRLAEGALIGEDLRQQTLREIEQEEKEQQNYNSDE